MGEEQRNGSTRARTDTELVSCSGSGRYRKCKVDLLPGEMGEPKPTSRNPRPLLEAPAAVAVAPRSPATRGGRGACEGGSAHCRARPIRRYLAQGGQGPRWPIGQRDSVLRSAWADDGSEKRWADNSP